MVPMMMIRVLRTSQNSRGSKNFSPSTKKTLPRAKYQCRSCYLDFNGRRAKPPATLLRNKSLLDACHDRVRDAIVPPDSALASGSNGKAGLATKIVLLEYGRPGKVVWGSVLLFHVGIPQIIIQQGFATSLDQVAELEPGRS